MQQKREARGPGEQQPEKAKPVLPGRRCSRRRRLPEAPREREPAAARGLATEAAAAQAAGWASGARRGTARRRNPRRLRGARCTNQGGGAGSALRAAHACALVRLPALPGWVGRCAPTARPPARRRLPGAWGRERPMRARGDGGRRGAGCAVRKRAARSGCRQSAPFPRDGIRFSCWVPKGREGEGGSERSERRGKGERAATRRARIKARPLGRATAYPIGWAGWGMASARQVGPRHGTSISARLGIYRGPAGRLSLPRYGARMAYPLPASRCAALIGSQTRTKRAGIGPRIARVDFDGGNHKST